MGWNLLDDAISRIVKLAGLIGVFWETVVWHIDRPYLLFLFACMMGLSKFDSLPSISENKENK